MPFIEKERREAVMNGTMTKLKPGDRCYYFYQGMMDRWEKAPSWTTVHEIYKEFNYPLNLDTDDVTAKRLAWLVFFDLHVIPYEIQKRIENGDIRGRDLDA